ncbi:MAG: 30S ribosomal protein S11 [Patescibacteria group bacterium]
MGKKQVKTESSEQIIKEGVAVEQAVLKSAVRQPAEGGSKKIENGQVFIKATYNNTLITVTDETGNVIAWASAGSLGFNGPKKATPFAASKIISALTEKLKKSGPINIKIMVNGTGGGRDSAIRSLAGQGFNILSIKDVTPIPFNGPRRPKVRRV